MIDVYMRISLHEPMEATMHRTLRLSGAAFALGFVMLCALLLPASRVAAEPLGDVTLGDTQRIALTSQAGSLTAKPAVRVVSADATGLTLEFELPAIDVRPIAVDGETYQAIDFEGAGSEGEVGEPMLPVLSRFIMIPQRAGVSFRVTASETTELSGYRPFPVQDGDTDGAFARDAAAYARVGYGEAEPARIGEPALARDLRLVPITFRPVRYDASRGTIEAASRITVRVDYTGEDLRNVPARTQRTVAPSFDQLYRALVVNYEGPLAERDVVLGTYVIICPNDANVLSRLQPLIEWRTRKGLDVRVATTAETGTTKEAIQAWLRNAYTTWPNPPEYVTLVGDVDGAIAIPCWHESYSGYQGESDFPYSQLDGEDPLSDVHIGRISVNSNGPLTAYDQLQIYVDKIVSYESTPYMADTNWYTQGTVVGDPTSSYISVVQIMQWVKRRLLETGFTEVDTIFGSPYVAQMTASLNQGSSIFAYRGWLGMSGWNNGYTDALTNGRKMPFGVNITCGTGSFAGGTAISEEWMRAGTLGAPKGGIACIGTATTGTHTRFNNSVMQGIFRGLYWERLWTFGQSLTRGKYELYLDYWGYDSNHVWWFTYWNNLMGDPAGELWTGVPQPISVTYPTQVAIGANSVQVEVTASGQPVAGALVCLWKGSETHITGYTDDDGRLELPVDLPTAGDLKLTVSKHDVIPLLATITVGQAERFATYAAHTIDDDAIGTSLGNGDGLVNPLERIEVPVQLRNVGSQTATAVTATLTSDDPYVVIDDDAETFGDIAAGATAWSADDFDITLLGNAPHGHVIRFGLDAASGAETWHSLFEIPVVAPAFTLSLTHVYDFGPRIDPGEAGRLSVKLLNTGGAASLPVTGTLHSESGWMAVTDSLGAFPAAAIGGTTENTGDMFSLFVSAAAFDGCIAPMRLVLESAAGVIDTVRFTLALAPGNQSDPGGPDGYGYYMFDNTDAGYPQAPVYSWIEIDPAHGGPGTDCGLTDFGAYQDDSEVFTLPFAFKFYGAPFTKLTICSNGWVAMGSTNLTTGQNWPIPDAAAPNYMIAPMWDDLFQTGTNRVYRWYDATQHRYVVQWSRMILDSGGATENFEVILYDPIYHPTPTGDGEIVFQYETFNNSDGVNQYCTVGIQNGDQSDGLEYTYFNLYDQSAAIIQSGRAIKFVVPADVPQGTLAGHVYNLNGTAPVAGAQVTLLQSGAALISQVDGSYAGDVLPGTFTAIATHTGFEADTVNSVIVRLDQTTQQNFYMRDIAPPAFSNTTVLDNTIDATGPYEILTTITENAGLSVKTLNYRVTGGWVTVPLTAMGSDTYSGVIPGQAGGSQIHYYLRAVDTSGLVATDPPLAPAESFSFWVLIPALVDDVEQGTGGWAHAAATEGFADQWHRSSQRNHTTAGGWAWKFGDTGAGEYANLADGALVSEPFELEMGGVLSFWHWIDAETSAGFPGRAQDGGLVEISVEGGPWTQITPVGGYPYLIRTGEIAGPFAADTPVYSGSGDWSRAVFMLDGVSGTVQLRWRFGSDGATGGAGWFIDDVVVGGYGSGAAGVDPIALRPTRLALYQNAPNPFGGQLARTRIRFDLPGAAPVRIDICDPTGRRVSTLMNDRLAAGTYTVEWNGLDGSGNRMESGVYFYILQAGDQRTAQRMMLLK
jgi:hypothetical protein